MEASEMEMSIYVEGKFKEIKFLLLQAARQADKHSQKQANIYKYKQKQMKTILTPELSNISTQRNHWYSQWVASDKKNIEASKNYRFFKQRFRIILITNIR